jgi:hypothetical protein
MIKRNMELLRHCEMVVDAYMAKGLRLTLRQLYYQLVTKNLVTNEENSYERVGRILSKARLGGMIDWNAIEDRGRVPKRPPEYDSLQDLIRAAKAWYRLPRLNGQHVYPELWVEKDALAGVLAPIARRKHVVLMVNKGYSSQSAMYAAARRIVNSMERNGSSRAVIFYLGDHDPSGMDMVRDIQARLDMFTRYAHDIEVKKIAITREQIEEYSPPPNPTKLSDSRAKAYIEEFGYDCWEVDALPPEELSEIVTTEVNAVLVQSTIDGVMELEDADKKILEETVDKILEEKSG